MADAKKAVKDVDFSLANAMRQGDFFSSLTEDDTKALLSAMDQVTYKKGEVLVKEGEPTTKMFIIKSGRISKKKGYREDILQRGQISGLLHFFQRDPSFGTLTALDDSEVYQIDSDKFKTLLSSHPSLNSNFIRFLSHQVRKQCNVISDIRSKLVGGEGLNIAFFDSKAYMRDSFDKANTEKKYGFVINWYKEKLGEQTVELARGCQVVCCFVNDVVNQKVIERLAEQGVQLIAMRCAGYDNVDLKAAKKAEISVTRVPAYSPYAVAEFAATLMMTLNRKVHKAHNRVKESNFSLNGLVGFDMFGKTVGVLGTGKIGKCLINIVRGFGCHVLCFDVFKDPQIEAMADCKYVTKEEVLQKSDIVTLHAPLLKSTYHMIGKPELAMMKKNAILINTSRGGLVDSLALLDAILAGQIAGAALDVYEGERDYFFENRADKNIGDTTLARLIACHNVVVTSHQAFLTQEALDAIAESTLNSVKEYQGGKKLLELTNVVKDEYAQPPQNPPK